MTRALSNVAANATIHVGTGTYSAVRTGETFPLTVQMPGLTMVASNANAALTVVDNAGVSGQRVWQAQGQGAVTLCGMTFQGGRFASGATPGASRNVPTATGAVPDCRAFSILSKLGAGAPRGIWAQPASHASAITNKPGEARRASPLAMRCSCII